MLVKMYEAYHAILTHVSPLTKSVSYCELLFSCKTPQVAVDKPAVHIIHTMYQLSNDLLSQLKINQIEFLSMILYIMKRIVH